MGPRQARSADRSEPRRRTDAAEQVVPRPRGTPLPSASLVTAGLAGEICDIGSGPGVRRQR